MDVASALRVKTIDAIDARALLRALLRVSDVHLVAHGERTLTAAEERQFQALIARRVAGEPVAYITGEREFYGRSFAVSPVVLIPRPETELLVELSLERLSLHASARVLDLGTGSGCVALSIALERGAARVTATDRSDAALAIARKNAQRLGAGNVDFQSGDWFGAVGKELFDLIVSNPPYIVEGDAHLDQGDLRFEPVYALAAGADGMVDIRTIVGGARAHLAPGGWLLFEHGYDQALRCRALLGQAGFADVQSWCDLANIERVSGGRAPL